MSAVASRKAAAKETRYCETGPTVYSPYPRGLESLNR